MTANENDENNVTIAFTMGVKALEKGHKTVIMLLSDAVHLAEKNYAAKIDIGTPFEPVNNLLETFLDNGGKLQVCSSCMEHNGITQADIIKDSEIIKADDVIDNIMQADRSLQLN